MANRSISRVQQRRCQQGAATIEYVVVASVVLVVLIGGENVIHALWQAMQKVYSAFYYAISAAL
jgi:Flp pilus assembly pilin Flp